MMTDAIVIFVANALWQSSLAALCGLIIARLPRIAASTRYLLGLAAFSAALLLPLVSLLPDRATGSSSISFQASAKNLDATGGGTPAAITTLASTRTTANAVALLWFATSLFAAIHLAIRSRRARHLRRTSALIETIGAIELRESALATTPMTFGRVILLPTFLREPRLRAAALRHELAHVRHRDYAALLAIELLAIPLAFHPLVHLLRRALDELRELRCDDDAASNGRADYARALVAIARLSTGRNLALGMATTALERRVAALQRPGRHATAGAIVAALLLGSVVAFAACHRLHPSIGDIEGKWELDAAASDFGATPPYTYFVQEIHRRGNELSVAQHRRSAEGDRSIDWRFTTDGVERPVAGLPGARGSAKWEHRTLMLSLHGPRAYREQGTARVTDDGRRMVCEVTNSGSRHPGHWRVVFRRVR
jgi:beta-lactamase regulating signal transducer with metallopeptidase domain